MSNTGKLPANQRMASVSNTPPGNKTNTPAPSNANKPIPPNTLANKINNRSNSASSITNSLNQNGNPAHGSEPSATDSIMDRVNSFIDNSTNYVKSFGNNTNTATKSSSNKPNTTKASANETSTLETVSALSDNYIIILGLFIAFILLVLLYFFSKSFNVGRVVEKMKIYGLYQKINNYDFRDKSKADATLNQVRIASSFNACNIGAQMLSYTSEEILKQVLRCGARFIELNVFSDTYGTNGIPVIDSGYKRGEWKLMLNSTTFESAIAVLAQNAFKIMEPTGGAPNPEDPIFLSLNLSTGHNTACLDRLADILVDYFSDRLLGPKYAYQFTTNIQNIKMADLEGRVVIFASPGYEGSKLEELINSSWLDETVDITGQNIIAGSNAGAGTGTVTESFINPAPSKTSGQIPSLDNIKESLAKNNKTKVTKSKKATKPSAGNNAPGTGQASVSKLEEALKREFGDALVKKTLAKRAEETSTTSNKEDYQDVDESQESGDINFPSLDDQGSIIRQPKIIRISSKILNSPGFDGTRLRAHNKTGLTIVVPHTEGDYLTRNYDPSLAWELGCQFVSMNYQVIDESIDKYITQFEKAGIILASESS